MGSVSGRFKGRMQRMQRMWRRYHECNTQRVPSQALCVRDRQTETRSKQHGHGGTQFGGEAARRAHLRDLVAQGAGKVVVVKPDADAE